LNIAAMGDANLEDDLQLSADANLNTLAGTGDAHLVAIETATETGKRSSAAGQSSGVVETDDAIERELGSVAGEVIVRTRGDKLIVLLNATIAVEVNQLVACEDIDLRDDAIVALNEEAEVGEIAS